MASFLAIEINTAEGDITGSTAHVQVKQQINNFFGGNDGEGMAVGNSRLNWLEFKQRHHRGLLVVKFDKKFYLFHQRLIFSLLFSHFFNSIP